eukprot:6118858-Pleurochrysis_carterae.AAC.1
MHTARQAVVPSFVRRSVKPAPDVSSRLAAIDQPLATAVRQTTQKPRGQRAPSCAPSFYLFERGRGLGFGFGCMLGVHGCMHVGRAWTHAC